MKVKYIGKSSDPFYFIQNKVYEKTGESHGLWRVIDETGDDYLYDPACFQILSDAEYDDLMKLPEYRPHKCPVCGKTEFSMKNSGDMCTECGWIDFDDASWNQGQTLESYKQAFEDGKAKYGDWSYFKDTGA